MRIFYQKYVMLLVLVLAWNSSVFGQQKVIAEADSIRHIVGDKISVRISAPKMSGMKSYIVQADFTKSKFEQIDTVKVDTSSKKEAVIYVFHVAAYDSGKFYFPPITINYKKGKDTGSEKIIITDSIPIQISRIPVDTTQPPKPIKDPAGVPYSLSELLPWILGGMAIIGILIFVIWYTRRKRKLSGENIPKIPLKPPFDEAMEALVKLRKEKLWEQGESKDYHIALTDILRRYIHRRWNVDAFEMTSAEIMKALRGISLSKTSKKELREVLELADLVKFAKRSALPDENTRSMEMVENFVKATKPLEKVQSTESVDAPEKDISGHD